MVSSVVGFYSSPLFTRLLPERRDTPLTKVGARDLGWPLSLPGCRTPGPHSAWLWVSLCGDPRSPPTSMSRVLGSLPHWESFPSPRGGPGSAVPPPTLLPPHQIIGNCVSLLVLSSALPVFSRTLGESPGGLALGCPQHWGTLTNPPTPAQGSPGLTCWGTLAASTGWGTSTSSSSTTWALRGSPRSAWSRESPGPCRPSSSAPLVRAGVWGQVLGCPVCVPHPGLMISLCPGLHKLPLPMTCRRPLSQPS